MLIPFLQVRLVFLILHLVFFDQLLQENLEVRLIFRERKPQCSEEGVGVGFDLWQRLVF